MLFSLSDALDLSVTVSEEKRRKIQGIVDPDDAQHHCGQREHRGHQAGPALVKNTVGHGITNPTKPSQAGDPVPVPVLLSFEAFSIVDACSICDDRHGGRTVDPNADSGTYRRYTQSGL